jgi:hypothetical protein
MSDFRYLSDKILESPFQYSPFKHIVIDNFLKEEHLGEILNDKQIHFSETTSTVKTIECLKARGYKVQDFPGCTSDLYEYIMHYQNNSFPKFRKGTPVSSYGITFRLSKVKNQKISEILNYMNGDEFKNALETKFQISNKTKIITAIQKNLSHYEISPHPDIRGKALTYLLNINKGPHVDDKPVHTHLLEFNEEWKHIKNYWENNIDVERTWVPWEWCNTVKTTNKNNSIVLFAPSNDTLHAAKMIYDHNKFQRTQVYGNLMYVERKQMIKKGWKELEKV